MRLIPKGRSGSVFVTTMLSMLMMLLMGGQLHQMVSYDLSLVNHMRRASQAQSLAEAGLLRALATLKSNWAGRKTPANFPLTAMGEGTYDASYTEISGRPLVSSVGLVQGVSRTVKAELKAPPVSAMNYVLAAGGSIRINHNYSAVYHTDGWIEVAGSWYAGSSITVTAHQWNGVKCNRCNTSVRITGRCDSNGPTNLLSPQQVAGGINTAAGSVTFPTIDFEYYKERAQKGGYYLKGDLIWNDPNEWAEPVNAPNKIVYIDGDLIANTPFNSNNNYFVTGNVQIRDTMNLFTWVGYSQLRNKILATKNGSISLTLKPGSSRSYVGLDAGFIYSGSNITVVGGGGHRLVADQILCRGDFSISSYGNYAATVLGDSIKKNFTIPEFASDSTGGSSCEVRAYIS